MWLRKILYFSSIIVLFVVNCLYVEYQFAVLLFIVTVIPLVSYIHYFLANAGLRMSVMNNGPVIAADEKIIVRYVANKKYIFAVPYAHMNTSIYYSNCDEHISRRVILKTAMKGVPQQSLKFKPIHCGIVNIRIDELTVRDMLGIFESKYQFNLMRKIVVLPELIRLDRDDFGAGGQVEEYIESYNATDNTEIMELREYHDGDKMARIHWKRSFVIDDEIIVKEYGEEVSRRNLIFVDLSSNGGPDFRRQLDLIYKYTFAIANSYMEKDSYATVMAWDAKNERNVVHVVTNAGELMNMMVAIMSLRCEQSDGMYSILQGIRVENGTKPLLITTCDTNTEQFEVINVCRDTIEDVLTWVK